MYLYTYIYIYIYMHNPVQLASIVLTIIGEFYQHCWHSIIGQRLSIICQCLNERDTCSESMIPASRPDSDINWSYSCNLLVSSPELSLSRGKRVWWLLSASLVVLSQHSWFLNKWMITVCMVGNFHGYKFYETGQNSGFKNVAFFIFVVGESGTHKLASATAKKLSKCPLLAFHCCLVRVSVLM